MSDLREVPACDEHRDGWPETKAIYQAGECDDCLSLIRDAVLDEVIVKANGAAFSQWVRDMKSSRVSPPLQGNK